MAEESTTGIRIIPPVVYVVGLAIGFGLEQTWPIVDIPVRWTIGGAAVFIFLSVALAALSIRQFRRMATPFDVRKPAPLPVTKGPYQRSRNPGYLALTVLYVASTRPLGSVWVLVLLIPVLVPMTYGVIARKEVHLEDVFGDRYREYKSRVRRWL